MTKPSKIGFAVIGVLVAALVAGYIGARFAGGGSGGGGGTDVSTAAWIDKVKDSGELRVGCADAPPTIVVAADGTCTGPDLIPLQDLADELGVKMTTKATSWQSIVAGLQADHSTWQPISTRPSNAACPSSSPTRRGATRECSYCPRTRV